MPPKVVNIFFEGIKGHKKIFGEEPDKNLLLDFLNELPREEQGKIQDVTYLKTKQLGDTHINSAEIARFTPDQVRSYEKSLKYYRDLKNPLDTAFDEGKAANQGETVTRGLKQGLGKKVIAALTGVSAEEIEKIAEDID